MKITAIIACCLLLFQSFSPVAFVFLNEALAVGDDLSSDETASASAVPNISDDEKNGEILPADKGVEISSQPSAEQSGTPGNQSTAIEQESLKVTPVNGSDTKEAAESSASAAPVSQAILSPQDLPAPPPQSTTESVSPSSSSLSNQVPVSTPPNTQPTLASDNPSPTVLSFSTNNISNNIQPRLDAAISSPSPIAIQTSKFLSLLSPESDSIGPSAQVSTDKADYSPTEVAVISASGLNAGQTYILIISSNDPPTVNLETSVAGDASGNFVYNYQLDGNFRPNYNVELKDSSGRVLAATAFTDSDGGVTVTAATGGSAVSADTTGGSYTSLTGPILTETKSGSIGTGTVILNVPLGFAFDTNTPTPTVLVNGDADHNKNINNISNGSIFAPTSVSPTQIVITVSSNSTATSNTLTWQNVRVRPSAGAPLANGNISNSGTANLDNPSSSNYGTLTEVAGAKNKLAVTTQPSAAAATNADFGTKPVVAVEDQFGNTETSDNSSTVTASAVLSTQNCGGTNGSGVLTSTPDSGAAVADGLLTYTAMQYSTAQDIKICFSSSGAAPALSNAITVSAPPAVTGVTAATANGSYKAGETISIQIVFDQSVAVSGTPQLTLATGTPAATAVNYTGGSPGATLTFNYLVSAGNTSADLDYAGATALALNGGAIKDTATGSINAVLTLAPPGSSGSLSANKNIVIDTTAPTVPTLASPDDGSVTNNNNPTLTWSGSTDALSGVKDYRYQVADNAGFSPTERDHYTTNTYYTPDLSSFSDRAWYWRVWARDNAGNTGSWSSARAFTIDTIAPTSSVTSPAGGSLLRGTVAVTADASDAVGVAKVEFWNASVGTKIGEDSSAPYSINWDTSSVADGNHSLWTVAYDSAGNNQSSAQVNVSVDNTPPSTTDSGTDTNWHNSDITVSLTCTDSGSGCSKTYYTTDGSAPTTLSPTGGSVTLTSDGIYTIKYFSKDNAGNSEPVKTAANTVKIDKTNPSVPGIPSTTTPTNSTLQTWNWSAATDALSGLFQYLWRTDAPTNGSVSGVSKTTGLSEGLWNFWVKAEDSAGNFSGESKGSVLVDTTAPATPTASPAGGDYTLAQKVSLSSSDSNGYEIYFTTDGSTPTSGSGKYTGTITISGDTTLKAVAVDGAGNQSSVMTQSYGIAPSISGETSGAVTQSSVTINWTTDLPATSRVIYDSSPHSTLGAAPNYGYAHSTAELDTSPKVMAHSVALNDLTAGVTYYYRTVSKGSPESLSDERRFDTTAGAVLGATAVVAAAVQTIVGGSLSTGGETLAAEPSATVAAEPQVLAEVTPQAAPAPQPTAETNQNAAAESSWGTWVLFALLAAFVLLVARLIFPRR